MIFENKKWKYFIGIFAGIISRILVDIGLLPPLIPMFINTDIEIFYHGLEWAIIMLIGFFIVDLAITNRKQIIQYFVNQLVELTK